MTLMKPGGGGGGAGGAGVRIRGTLGDIGLGVEGKGFRV